MDKNGYKSHFKSDFLQVHIMGTRSHLVLCDILIGGHCLEKCRENESQRDFSMETKCGRS